MVGGDYCGGGEYSRRSGESEQKNKRVREEGGYSGTIEAVKKASVTRSSGERVKMATSGAAAGRGKILENGGIDTDLYSRQIGTLGFDAMGKLIKLNILISGMKGIGAETAKNLILSGPKRVSLHDDGGCEMRDMASNFCITEEDVKEGRTRADASVSKLGELNNYVDVDVLRGDLKQEDLASYDVVVASDKGRDWLVWVNEYCRTHHKGFICCDVYGLTSSVFVDFGPEFTCVDRDGEEPKSVIISGITQDEAVAAVTVHCDKAMPFQDGDHVKFQEVQGMTEINDIQHIQIKLTGKDTFTIMCNTKKFGAYLRDGMAKQVKLPVIFKFKSFKEACLKPIVSGEGMLITADLAKFGRPEQLHFIHQAILSFRDAKGHLPETRNAEDAEKVLVLARELLDEAKKHEGEEGIVVVESIDEDLCRNVAQFSRCHISPMCSFIGGIVAQEVVKFTGKYSPLRQWFYFDSMECLSKVPQGDSVSRPGSRYEDHIAIWGEQAQKRLADTNLFMVGAGALGCELLKLAALMGICCGGNGKLTVTDMDNIEVSNLNRQFLFRREHVGASKSVTSGKAARAMNSSLSVDAIEVRVGPDTEDRLDDAFWQNLDVVVNALDNVQARQYVDGRCVWFNKPLMESGTLGTKANVQVVLPNMTQSYSDSQDPPEESIPLCTLKHFPHAIEHTIEWSRDLFQGLFCHSPQEAQRFAKDWEGYLHRLDSESTAAVQRERLQKIQEFILPEGGSVTLEGCMRRACLLFHDNFYIQIAQLIHTFPRDHVTSDGRPFWSGPKRAPTPIMLSQKDESHLDFIVAATNLLAAISGVPQCCDRTIVRNFCEKVALPTFEGRDVRIKVDDRDSTIEGAHDDEQVRDRLEQQLREKMKNSTAVNVEPLEFEKDDDTNFHVDFICACANLRARNYNIEECTHHKCKMIAGKIIPAMATTTAMVTGLVSFELLKTLLGGDQRPLEDFKNAFINLGLPLWLLSEPLPPCKTVDKDYDPVAMGPVKARPHGFTTWDKCTIKIAAGTVRQLIDALAKEFNVAVSILSIGNVCIYNSFLPAHKKQRLDLPVSELYETIIKQKLSSTVSNHAVEASCQDIDDDSDVIIPRIKFEFV
eukprot:GHVS01072735.1.p1 GENE.GHVS01072735.1~~GHVS01072735.1.p1  ORF type:complete len:1106 (+),score=141.84 GHVS01072735.1:89-3406(+)